MVKDQNYKEKITFVDYYRFLLGITSFVLGLFILYHSILKIHTPAIILGILFVAFGIYRLKFLFDYLENLKRGK